MSTATRRYTPEDLLALPDDGRVFELVDGLLVELNMGAESEAIGSLFYYYMQQFCMSNPLGRAVANGTFKCFVDAPEKVRRPDAAFISFARLPAAHPIPRGFFRVVPDLAVEVVSPTDFYEAVELKIDEYLAAGVLMAWVALPFKRVVRVYRPGRLMIEVGADSELDGEDVLPGFKCPVASLFPSPRPSV